MTKFIFRATAVVALAAVIGFIASCKKDSPSAPALTTEQAENLRLIGFDPDKAILDKNGDIQIEDIRIESAGLANLVATQQQQASSNPALEDRHLTVANFVAIPYAQTSAIRYKISNSFTDEQHEAIVAGIKMWENASTNLHFVEVAAHAQVVVFLDNTLVGPDGLTIYGLGKFPDGTGPGNSIQINMSAILSDCRVDDAICIRNVVTHEMGHCLGFGHNDEVLFGAGNWFLGSPGPIGVDQGSIMNSGPGGEGLVGLGQLSGPNDNDRKVVSAMYPASGITVPITGILAEWVDEDRYNFRLKYSQPGLNRSYTAYVQILQDGVVKKTKFVDIGIKSGGEIGFGVISLHPGLCQVKIFGINYRGDFTQSAYSTQTIMLE